MSKLQLKIVVNKPGVRDTYVNETPNRGREHRDEIILGRPGGYVSHTITHWSALFSGAHAIGPHEQLMRPQAGLPS